ncbi:hypothetical protein ABFS82_01G031200 [Erythranthe guttata]|uniref:uncharacterized protein LOC105975393 n=1 Tax=Erythranthe guttata TaxID=4155 RepID=UPI00064D7629|nr:PREDICTED: uncharacterized protein LOC105975393 [Erythranthe guttata]XP_012856047.1 PREDICTED: uncharacterized protein LOC105975393 [Erythranthe guttata]|eukprot:XP_012856046.1 PREDICTED: uncharacterized protein LOC105975393 [Erythranthe guttata]
MDNRHRKPAGWSNQLYNDVSNLPCDFNGCCYCKNECSIHFCKCFINKLLCGEPCPCKDCWNVVENSAKVAEIREKTESSIILPWDTHEFNSIQVAQGIINEAPSTSTLPSNILESDSKEVAQDIINEAPSTSTLPSDILESEKQAEVPEMHQESISDDILSHAFIAAPIGPAPGEIEDEIMEDLTNNEDQFQEVIEGGDCECRDNHCTDISCICYAVMEFCKGRCTCQGCRNIDEIFGSCNVEKPQFDHKDKSQDFSNYISDLPYDFNGRCYCKNGCSIHFCKCYINKSFCGNSCPCEDHCWNNVEKNAKVVEIRETTEFSITLSWDILVFNSEPVAQDIIDEAPSTSTLPSNILESDSKEVAQDIINEAPSTSTLTSDILASDYKEVAQDTINEAPSTSTLILDILESDSKEVAQEIISEAPSTSTLTSDILESDSKEVASTRNYQRSTLNEWSSKD